VNAQRIADLGPDCATNRCRDACVINGERKGWATTVAQMPHGRLTSTNGHRIAEGPPWTRRLAPESVGISNESGMTMRLLMCRPTYFAVDYKINAWMDPTLPVDAARALEQWQALHDTYLALGHQVDLIEPVEGLPDMVFAANGGTIVNGVALTVQFRDPERALEAPAYKAWFEAAGLTVVEPKFDNEGEGDLLLTQRFLLAGTGFRTSQRAHAEAQELLGVPVISLQLVDPRFYHLDTALCVLPAADGRPENIAYYPPAFSEGSQKVLRQLFPSAVVASESDAVEFGLNSMCDGRTVVMSIQAADLAAQLRGRGYQTIGLDMSELRKAGGASKCCTLEVRTR
jgi:N-dimethylarginine dimethylaminohydrolase